MTPESTGQQDLRTYLRIFWRWKFLFLAFLVLIPLASYLVERGKPNVYQSSTLVELQDISINTGASGAPIVTGNVDAVARLVTTTPVAAIAARFLHPPPTNSDSLLSEISATANSATGFLTITAQDQDPHRAAAIASAFAAALADRQSAQASQSLNQQIASAAKQLASVPPSNQVDRTTLSQQLGRLRALQGSIGSGAQVVQPAVAPTSPVGPKPRRAVELALVIALLLGVGAVLLAENSDRRLRTPEDVERLTNFPLLGTIPRSAFSPHQPLTPRNNEAFQMLSAALTYYEVDRPLESVVIVSSGAEEGKTTVAVGLGIAAARTGSRAILVDADLRRPQVSTRLGLPSADGLGAVLAGERKLSEVLIRYDVDDAPGGGGLLVLPAGPPPLNPSALISSPKMRRLLHELENQADLVIIDTAATLAVSDSLPLIQAASGIVMIVRMNRSSRAGVRRLQKVIASTRGTVKGLVVTGSASITYGYGGYAYHQTQNGNGHQPRRRLGLRRRDGPQDVIRSSPGAPMPDTTPGQASRPGTAEPAHSPGQPPQRPVDGVQDPSGEPLGESDQGQT